MPDLHTDYQPYTEPDIEPKKRRSGKARLGTPKSVGPLDWEKIRREFVFQPGIIYLNSGTEGSMPKPVLSQYSVYLQKWASSPSYFFAFSEVMDDWQKRNREKVAQFLGTTLDNICLTNNTSEGLSMTALGLNFKAGDEVISTLQDFPSSESVFHVLQKTRGIVYTQLPLPTPTVSKEEIIAAFKTSITPKTRALCFSHINYTTGLRMPAKELCDLARENNLISIVDGAHALGMIPLDVEAMGCDFYATSGHKWLNGPPGTGVLYIRDAQHNPFGLVPIISELYGFETAYTIVEMLQIRGCNNTPGFTAMVDAIEFNQNIGKETIEDRILELNTYLKNRVVKEWGEQCLLSPPGEDTHSLSSGIASFIPSKDYWKRYDKEFINDLSWKIIGDYKIWIRSISFLDKCSDGNKLTYAIRVSTNLFNNFEDIDKLMAALREVASKI
ncbi:MAG: aminotransferase class V-fold PLP-dependent enzyme [Candidatus Omnitrophota bacterium]